jgi:flagellar motor protein MotB
MAKGVKIPKKIAGVKLPKKVRKRARKAVEMSASPIVRDLAAAAIGAAAGSASGNGEHRHRIAETFRSAAIDGLRRFLEGLEKGLREAGADAGREPGAKAAKKAKAKKRRRPPETPESPAPGV